MEEQNSDIIINVSQESDVENTEDNNWNSNIELYLMMIAKHACILKKKHISAAKSKTKKSNIYSIIVMIITSFSVLASVTISIIVGIRIHDNNNILIGIKEGITAILLTLATMFAGIHNLLRHSNNAYRHKKAVDQFSYLHNDIQACLTLSRYKRPDAIIYQNEKWQEYENIKKNAPFVNDNKKNNIIDNINEKLTKERDQMIKSQLEKFIKS
jgi:hypothetical protein